MSFTPSFTVSGNNVSTNTFTLTDTSTGADALIANRLIYINLTDNSLFTGAPIQFPLSAGTSISPSILTSDFAWSITVAWLDSGGNVLYQVVGQIGVFTGFLEWFYYGLCQQISAQANLLNDTNYFNNWSRLRNLIDSAGQAITIGSSIYNSQSMILLAQAIVANSQNDF